LTPLSFLARTAAVYPDLVQHRLRRPQLHLVANPGALPAFLPLSSPAATSAAAIRWRAMLPNIPAMNEVHFAVPMAGAVLNALTSGSTPPDRVSSSIMAGQIILVDPEFSGVITKRWR